LKSEYYSPPFFEKTKPLSRDPLIQSIKEISGEKRKRDSILTQYSQKKFKQSDISKNELERYKELQDISVESDPLRWWCENERNYPTISEIAKIYLAIPASQATCERSFSVARRICTDFHTSLTPQHVEQLTLLKQNANEIYEYETQDEEDRNLTVNNNEIFKY